MVFTQGDMHALLECDHETRHHALVLRRGLQAAVSEALRCRLVCSLLCVRPPQHRQQPVECGLDSSAPRSNRVHLERS